MKVLLVVPPYRYKGKGFAYLSASDFPTGLAYIASALKNAGHEVVGLNLNNSTKYPSKHLAVVNELHSTIEKEKPDLIGLGGLCIDYAFIKDAIEVARKCADTPIVMGGGIINNDKEFIFNLLKPDFCIWGEAEDVIVQLANALEKDKCPRDVDNLAYWTESGAVFNKTNYDYCNIDDRAFPDYEPFGIQEMLDDFSLSTRVLYSYARSHPRVMTINTARHCPFNCSFCIHRGGPKYRARSVPNIMAEIKEFYEKYKFNILIMDDELFAVNKKRMKDFCNTLIKEKKKYGWDFGWMFQTHANARLDRETLELAKKAGCYLFSYGMESASPQVLKSMNKKTDVSQYIEAIELAKEVGIAFSGNLLFGDPVEDDRTIHESLDFWAKYCQESNVFLALLEPYPGCKIFDYCMEKSIITDKEKYYETMGEINYNMTQMSNPQFTQWVNFLSVMERIWIMTTSTKGSIREDLSIKTPMLQNGNKAYTVFAECPFCGQGLTYTGIWNQNIRPLFMGVGCQHCQKKIRVDLEENA